MRKHKREIKEYKELFDVIKNGSVCVLAFDNKGDAPYILPLNYGVGLEYEKTYLYFHSALEGKKIDLMKENNIVSFLIYKEKNLIYEKEKGYCTMEYESVIGKGKIEFLNGADKFDALKKLMAQYHNGEEVYFNTAAIDKTLVYRLEVLEMRGKRK